MSMEVLFRNGRLGLRDEPASVYVEADRVVAVGPEADARVEHLDDTARGSVQIVDLAGRCVLPGLWDHHVHLDQQTLAEHALDLAGSASAADVVSRVAARLRSDPPEPGLALVGYGFRDALWPSPPHRSLLDAVSETVPIVMVSGDLHQGWLNGAAIRRYWAPDRDDGLVREQDWFPVLERVRDVETEVLDRWVAATARLAATRGVVGVVDFENTDPLGPWPRRHAMAAAAGAPMGLRVRVGVWPAFLDEVIRAGLRSGDPLPGTRRLVTIGNLKVISDGSLNTRTAYCFDPYPGASADTGDLGVPPEALRPVMDRAWRSGLGCSIHAIGDRANALVLDAFAEVGARGTVEHAQLLTDDDVARFAALGVAASVQPEHAHDDRDVADQLWAGRTARAFPYGALHRAGASLLLGSDAPVAPLDPLLTIAAAISRSRDGRTPWHPEQEIPLPVALAASTAGGRTEPRAGDPADLTIVDLDVRTASADQLRTATVSGTLVAGQWTHRSGI